MAYTPISGSVPQFQQNAAGASANGYYLKGYSAGTTTPLSMGTDSTPTSTLAKCALNSRGEPISNDADETTVFIPHFNASYKLVLYTNSTDADNNTTANAAWVVDNISGQFDASQLNYTASVTVEQRLDNLDVDSYATLRGLTSSQLSDGDVINVTDGGIAGQFVVKTGTVTDNGGTRLVFTDDSNRYAERVYNGVPYANWWDMDNTGVSDVGATINTAYTYFNKLQFGLGEYRVSTAIAIPDNGHLISCSSEYGAVILNGDASTNIIEVSQSGLQLYQQIEGFTFRGAGTSVTAIKGSTNYNSAMRIKDNHFDISLTKAIDGNFINLISERNNIGYYGSPSRITVGYQIDGVAGTNEANHNMFIGDRFINIAGNGVTATEAWNMTFIGCDFEVLTGYSTDISGGFVTNYTNCWFERCGNTSTADGLFKFANGTSGQYSVNFYGGVIQVNPSNNTKVFDEAGSLVVRFHGVAFGGLATGGPYALANNKDKFILGTDSYYPGGFSDWSVPSVVENDKNVFWESFNEQEDGATTYVKKMRATDSSYASTIAGLECERTASSAYNFLLARSDISGTPTTEHQLLGNGGAYHSFYIALKDGVTAPSSSSGEARIYVDTADGDLKVVFGDGTVKTIMTDT